MPNPLFTGFRNEARALKVIGKIPWNRGGSKFILLLGGRGLGIRATGLARKFALSRPAIEFYKFTDVPLNQNYPRSYTQLT